MKVLFDQGTPVPLRKLLTTHQVSTAYELDWQMLTNGDLLNQAELSGFEVLVTTDQNLKYQQNLLKRVIAIVVLTSTSWPRIRKTLPEIVAAIENSKANGYIEITIPYE
jgi:hypothetical protein